MFRHKKTGKSSPSGLPPKLDMNPMVDMAFLLVTFFMLTTTFKTDELLSVKVPMAHSEIPIPGKNMAVVGVSDSGLVTFAIDGKQVRKRLLQVVAARHEITFTEDDLEKFSLSAGVAFPVAEMHDYIRTEPSKRKEIPIQGIPLDSIRNELKDWVQYARIVNPRVRYAIHGDRKSAYATIKKVMEAFAESEISRFNLITEQEF